MVQPTCQPADKAYRAQRREIHEVTDRHARPDKELAADTQRKLDQFLAGESWTTNRDCDMARWFDFVNQYQRDHGYTIDTEALRRLIEKRMGHQKGDFVQAVICRLVTLAHDILEFLRHTGR